VIPANTIVARVLTALNQAGIAHMLVGSFARNYYADPRSTNDADLVLAVTSGEFLTSFLDAVGSDFSLNDQLTFETNTGTFRSTLVHQESGFEVELFHLSNDPYDQERFRRRRPTSYEGQPTAVLTAEDVIITKLRWARGKDLDDVRDVIALHGEENLDWSYIHHWTEQHGRRAKLDDILSRLRPPN
jgi:predicted nucleotidyltransferase